MHDEVRQQERVDDRTSLARSAVRAVAVAFVISIGFNVVGIVRVQQLSSQRTRDLHAQVKRNTDLTGRLAIDESRLKSVGNSAVIDGCERLNALKARVATALDQSTHRTLSAQTLILHSPTSTDAQRAQALKLIASANATLGIVHSIFGTEKCKGPF